MKVILFATALIAAVSEAIQLSPAAEVAGIPEIESPYLQLAQIG